MMPLALMVVQLVPAADPAPARYARPDLLVEAADLADPKGRAKFRVLDIRGKEKYADGHVPGSVVALVGVWGRAVTEGKADAGFWKGQLAAVGVSPDRPTVVVGDAVPDAARAWWMLKLAGVPDVRILNGGWDAYAAANGEVSKEPTTATAPPHDWTPAPTRLADKAAVAGVVAKPESAQVLDARSVDEFTGETKLSRRGGHVPGATHLEWKDLIDPKSSKFLPPDRMAKTFADRKIDLGKPCVTYCQGGGRAAVLAFGLELMGANDVKDYYRSWGEWGNADDTPVEGKK